MMIFFFSKHANYEMWIVLCLFLHRIACLSPCLPFKPYLKYRKYWFTDILLKPVHRRQKQRNIFSFFIPKVPCFSVADIFRHSSKYCYDSFSHLELCRALGSERGKLPRDISESQQGALTFKGITTLFPLFDRHILSISVSTREMELNKHKLEGTK